MLMPATERLVAVLKSSDVERTAEWHKRADFDVRGSHPEEMPTRFEVVRELMLRDHDGYHLAFNQRSTLS
jgi:hypothetical protein